MKEYVLTHKSCSNIRLRERTWKKKIEKEWEQNYPPDHLRWEHKERKFGALNGHLYYYWHSPSKASCAHHFLCTFGISRPAFSTEKHLNVSTERFPHSDPSSCITRGEVTVKRRAQSSGRNWLSYFVYYIRYSHAQGQNKSRALLCKNHGETQSKSWCESWKACSHIDKTKATAEGKHTKGLWAAAVLVNIFPVPKE